VGTTQQVVDTAPQDIAKRLSLGADPAPPTSRPGPDMTA